MNEKEVYHERQIKELCALHSLNNLFQDCNAFTKSNLDSICFELSPDNWVNPHRSLLGTGNYDINVIMAALTVKGCSVIWFDKRKDPEVLCLSRIIGFILNIPSECRIGPIQLPLRRKHWIAIRSIRGVYYNLDSKLDVPETLGKGEGVMAYLRQEIRCKDKELFIVVTHEVEKSRTWSFEDESSYLDGINGQSESEISKPFSAPGLKFIDQDPSSLENSMEGSFSQTAGESVSFEQRNSVS